MVSVCRHGIVEQLYSPPIARYPKHLHHLIPQMVNHLHRDPAGLRLVEGPGGVAVQGGPGVFVDLSPALLVVVGVNELAGDVDGAVAAHLAGVGVEDVDAVDLVGVHPGLEHGNAA